MELDDAIFEVIMFIVLLVVPIELGMLVSGVYDEFYFMFGVVAVVVACILFLILVYR